MHFGFGLVISAIAAIVIINKRNPNSHHETYDP
jgi:hypothetical protein